MFAPAGTPHYPGLHNFNSRDWTSDQRRPEPQLGEVTNARRVYDLGEPTDPFPPAGRIGEESCIQGGERWPLPVLIRTFPGGFDSRCWGLTPPPADDPPFIFDSRDCHTQRRMAEVLLRTYTGDGTAAAALLQSYYPSAVISRTPNTSSIFPGSLVAVIGTTTLVIISGTTTPQQWATQGMWGTAGPLSNGRFSTLAVWQQAATRISWRVDNAGADATGPVVLVGHSYGGAVASIMAAEYRLRSSERSIQLLTFGSPKPGDQRLVNLLGLVVQTHLVNDGDPVTFLPPSGPEMDLVSAVVPQAFFLRWQTWQNPTGRVVLRSNGTRVDSPQPFPLYALLWRMAIEAVAGTVPEPVTAHNMSEYVRRVICPNQPAPSPVPEPSLLLYVRPETLQGYSLGDAVTTWEDESGGDRNLTGPLVGGAAFVDGPPGGVPSWVTCLAGVSLQLAVNLDLGTDHAIYLVGGRVSLGTPTGPALASGGTLLVSGPQLSTTQAIYNTTGTDVSVASALADDDLHVWSFRRWTDRVEVTRDGVVILNTSPLGLGGVVVNYLGSQGPITGVFRVSKTAEVQVYSLAPSDELHQTILYALLVKYGYLP